MLQLFMIGRYFVRRRVALLAVAAVALVVMMVLVVLSIMGGLLAETRERNHRWSGDVIVQRDSLVGFPYYEEFIKRLGQLREVEAGTPVVRTFGLLGRRAYPVQLFGVRLGEFCRVTGFQKTLHRLAGSAKPTFLVPVEESAGAGGAHGPDEQEERRQLSEEQRRRGCIVGRYLLAHEAVGARLRDYVLRSRVPWNVTVFGLSRSGAIMGTGVGEHQSFWYVDDSSTGLPLVDAQTMYVDFGVLQRLCFMDGSDGGPRRVNEIRVKLREGVGLAAGVRAVAAAWAAFAAQGGSGGRSDIPDDVGVQSWKEYRRSRIAPAEKEKNVMVMVFCMIGVVVVFVVFAIFYLVVAEKIKDLGIIKSVGGSGRQVGGIFLGFGLLVGTVGSLLGMALGWVIIRHSNEIEGILNRHYGFRLWDPAVYAIERIPDTVDGVQAVIIGLAAMGASVLGAVLPAWRAARLGAVDALRVE